MKSGYFLESVLMKAKYKRILLKLSGEGLMGDRSFGVDDKVVTALAKQIAEASKNGVEISVVAGGGNIFRGASDAAKGLNRSVADQIGMMATVMNGLFLQDALKKAGVDARVLSGLDMPKVCESYIFSKAISYLERKKVVIFVGGTGSPYFTTDTASILRAAEMGVDAMFKATQVDGVYDSDPKKNAKAKKYDKISYDEVLKKELKVMDMAAIALARDNKIPVVVFAQKGKNALADVLSGKGEFTVIK